MSYQELFNYMSDQHGLTLLESEMFDIIEIVRKIDKQKEKEELEDYQEGVFKMATLNSMPGSIYPDTPNI